MATLKSTFETERMDLSQMPTAIRLVLDQFRNLSFERGAAIHPRTGVRLEGFANLSGSHPRAGSEYTIVTAIEKLPAMTESDQADIDALDNDDWTAFDRASQELLERRRAAARAAGTIRTVHEITNVKLVTDDHRRLSIDVSSTGTSPFDANVQIEPPRRPTTAHIDLTAAITGHWFIAGNAKVDAKIDIEPLTRIGSSPASILKVSGRHRRGRGSIDISVAEAGIAMWTVDVTVRARGAGWLRPIAAVVALVARRRLQSGLDKMAQPNSDIVTEVRAGIAHAAQDSPDVIADEFVDEAFDGIVETLPSNPLR